MIRIAQSVFPGESAKGAALQNLHIIGIDGGGVGNYLRDSRARWLALSNPKGLLGLRVEKIRREGMPSSNKMLISAQQSFNRSGLDKIFFLQIVSVYM